MTSSGRRTARWPVRRAGPSDTRPATGRQGRAGIAVFLVLMIDSVVSGPFIPLSLPLSLWTGHLVDRLGARPIVLVAQLLQAAGFLGYLMVRNTGVLLLAATIDSLGQRAFWSSAFTLVSNLSDRQPGGHSRERWFGIIGSLRAAGYGVGAVVAGVALSEKSGPVYRGAISACAGLCWQQHCCSRRPCRGRPRCLPRHVSLCLAGVLWALWACLTAGPLWLPRDLWVPCLAVAVLCYSAAQLVHSPVANALSADAAPLTAAGGTWPSSSTPSRSRQSWPHCCSPFCSRRRARPHGLSSRRSHS